MPYTTKHIEQEFALVFKGVITEDKPLGRELSLEF
jgi:hypothetical protein